jgi:hypothetical protein
MFLQILLLIVAVGLLALWIHKPSATAAHIPGFGGFSAFTRRKTLRNDILQLALATKSKWIRTKTLTIDFIYATHPESAKVRFCEANIHSILMF